MKTYRIHLDSDYRTQTSTVSNSDFMINYDMEVKTGYLYIDNLVMIDSTGAEQLTRGVTAFKIHSSSLTSCNSFDISTKTKSNQLIFLPRQTVFLSDPGSHVVFKNHTKDGIFVQDFNFHQIFNIQIRMQNDELINPAHCQKWFCTLVIEEH